MAEQPDESCEICWIILFLIIVLALAVGAVLLSPVEALS